MSAIHQYRDLLDHEFAVTYCGRTTPLVRLVADGERTDARYCNRCLFSLKLDIGEAAVKAQRLPIVDRIRRTGEFSLDSWTLVRRRE